jgi:hypothetical protein
VHLPPCPVDRRAGTRARRTLLSARPAQNSTELFFERGLEFPGNSTDVSDVMLRRLFLPRRFQCPSQPPQAADAEVQTKPDSPWHDAARKYQVSRMSRRDLRAMADDLLAGGAISRPDYLLLTFDPEVFPAGGAPRHRATGRSDEVLDWISTIEERVVACAGDYAAAANFARIQDLLKKVEAAAAQDRSGRASPASVPITGPVLAEAAPYPVPECQATAA